MLARKPLAGTVAANVLAHGVGGLNIDGCRVGDEERTAAFTSFAPCAGNQLGAAGPAAARRGTQGEPQTYVGRWPANVLHDGSDEVLSAFPESQSRGGTSKRTVGIGFHGGGGGADTANYGSDSGSAARFFYSSKADTADRLGSKHPTVKPVDLMAYLCRLITPAGGVVLDPFAGSGTTGMACLREGFDAILIEREGEYVADIRRRLGHVRGDDLPLFGRAE